MNDFEVIFLALSIACFGGHFVARCVRATCYLMRARIPNRENCNDTA